MLVLHKLEDAIVTISACWEQQVGLKELGPISSQICIHHSMLTLVQWKQGLGIHSMKTRKAQMTSFNCSYQGLVNMTLRETNTAWFVLDQRHTWASFLNPALDVLARLTGQQVLKDSPIPTLHPTLGLYALAAIPRAYMRSRDLNSDSHAGQAHCPLSHAQRLLFLSIDFCLRVFIMRGRSVFSKSLTNTLVTI